MIYQNVGPNLVEVQIKFKMNGQSTQLNPVTNISNFLNIFQFSCLRNFELLNPRSLEQIS